MMENQVISLTKVFLKDAIQNLKIFKKNKKIKDSNFFWMIILIAIAVAFISYKAIEFFTSMGQPKIFLSVYFILITIVLLMQIILTIMNVLFFSKDLEYILPMPISSTKILIAKYVVIIIMTYVTELIFTFIPMIIYGLLTHISLIYFIVMPFVLLVFPLFFVTLISILTIVFMSLFKFIKNKNIYQGIIVSILIYSVLTIEAFTMSVFDNNSNDVINLENSESISQEYTEKINKTYEDMGKTYLVVNPTVEILYKPNNIKILIINFSELIVYNIIAFIIFIGIGRKLYLKNVLKSINVNSNKNKKTIKKRKNKRKKYSKSIYRRRI